MRIQVLRSLVCKYPLTVHHTSRIPKNEMDHAAKLLAFIFADKSYYHLKCIHFDVYFTKSSRKYKPELVL